MAAEGAPGKKGWVKYPPEHASVLLHRATRSLKRAHWSLDDEDAVAACQDLHGAAEFALKAVLIARNGEYPRTHELGRLWNEAEKLGGIVAERPIDSMLAEITKYSGEKRYDGAPYSDAVEMFNDFRKTAEGLVADAQARVPVLLAEHERTRPTVGPGPGDETARKPSSRRQP